VWLRPRLLKCTPILTKVQHTLRPFAVAMAGENEFDPFKD